MTWARRRLLVGGVVLLAVGGVAYVYFEVGFATWVWADAVLLDGGSDMGLSERVLYESPERARVARLGRGLALGLLLAGLTAMLVALALRRATGSAAPGRRD